MTKHLIVLALLLFSGCVGPDPIRLASERANYHLAVRCSDGWFRRLPYTVADEQVVRSAFDDWDKALTADEALVQWPIGSATTQPPQHLPVPAQQPGMLPQ